MYPMLPDFDFNTVLLFCHNFNAFLCVQMVSYLNWLYLVPVVSYDKKKQNKMAQIYGAHGWTVVFKQLKA